MRLSAYTPSSHTVPPPTPPLPTSSAQRRRSSTYAEKMTLEEMWWSKVNFLFWVSECDVILDGINSNGRSTQGLKFLFSEQKRIDKGAGALPSTELRFFSKLQELQDSKDHVAMFALEGQREPTLKSLTLHQMQKLTIWKSQCLQFVDRSSLERNEVTMSEERAQSAGLHAGGRFHAVKDWWVALPEAKVTPQTPSAFTHSNSRIYHHHHPRSRPPPPERGVMPGGTEACNGTDREEGLQRASHCGGGVAEEASCPKQQGGRSCPFRYFSR
jgi:hypothetical protein